MYQTVSELRYICSAKWTWSLERNSSLQRNLESIASVRIEKQFVETQLHTFQDAKYRLANDPFPTWKLFSSMLKSLTTPRMHVTDMSAIWLMSPRGSVEGCL